ncbi:hypothetical protein Glove_229g21 [Diversispora epigaea]|uniref:Uncharacterized protein n=1 Tax=Diversispora epigaea TaxID=1348612 RepID=A0A397IFU5_9GLOM|nr:hypothetical protein Glove_229g21 [Diversispora epigaea]
MLNLIPKWYLDVMYQCWDDDPYELAFRNYIRNEFLDADDNREIINTIFILNDSLEDMKFGKYPNLYTYDIDFEELSRCIDLEKLNENAKKISKFFHSI